jgi:hypothetical protein
MAYAPPAPSPFRAHGPCPPLISLLTRHNRTQSTHLEFNRTHGEADHLWVRGFVPTSTKGGVGETAWVLYGSQAPPELYPSDEGKAHKPWSKARLATTAGYLMEMLPENPGR